MEEVQLLIGDRDAAAAKNATFNRLNPVTGEVATKASAATTPALAHAFSVSEGNFADASRPAQARNGQRA